MIGIGEDCDDQDLDPNDGCSATCKFELYWNCDTGVSPTVCVPVCGDGKIRGTEECDD